MTEPLATLQDDEGVAVVTLNRPDHHNALVPDLLQDLLTALRAAGAAPARGIVLRAAGRSFSTGGDLREFYRNRDRIADFARELVGLLNDVVLALWAHPAPVACAVQGQVTGGALGLLLAADRVVMRQSVTVAPWYATVGFSPDGGWTALLPDCIGRAHAAHWLLTDACHDAETCFRLGLAQQVVPSDPTAAALQWVRSTAELEAGSLRSARRLLGGDLNALAGRLEAERDAFVAQVQTPDARQGIERFLNGRMP